LKAQQDTSEVLCAVPRVRAQTPIFSS